MSYGQYSNDPRGKSNPLARTATQGDKPKREVFPTKELPHLWAHQTQARARNAQGNLFFNGPTIYSYRESWPLARIYFKKSKDAFCRGRDALVLTNSKRYSNTTAKQQHSVNLAVRHLPCIAVPFPVTDETHPDHADNLKHLANVAADALAKAQRAMSTRTVSYLRNEAQQAIADAARYMTFFGIRRKAPTFPELVWNAATARAERIENPDPASVDKRERASAERKRRNAERDEYLAEQRRSMHAVKHARDFYRVGAARSSFRLGDVWGTDYEALRSSACLLRVAGEEIETSWGARVPVAAAPMVWALVERTRAQGGRNFAPYDNHRAISRVKIGGYAIDRIEPDGTLVAGCHTIPYSELRAMARALNLN